MHVDFPRAELVRCFELASPRSTTIASHSLDQCDSNVPSTSQSCLSECLLTPSFPLPPDPSKTARLMLSSPFQCPNCGRVFPSWLLSSDSLISSGSLTSAGLLWLRSGKRQVYTESTCSSWSTNCVRKALANSNSKQTKGDITGLLPTRRFPSQLSPHVNK